MSAPIAIVAASEATAGVPGAPTRELQVPPKAVLTNTELPAHVHVPPENPEETVGDLAVNAGATSAPDLETPENDGETPEIPA